MQQVLFSYLLALSVAVTGVFAQSPTPSIGLCEAQCFVSSYPEFARDNGCPDDPTYVKCICRRPSGIPIVSSCIQASCTDASAPSLLPYLNTASLCMNATTHTSTSIPIATAPTGGPVPTSGNTTVYPPKLSTTPTSSGGGGGGKATTTASPSGGVSGGMEFSAVMAGLVGIVGIFVVGL